MNRRTLFLCLSFVVLTMAWSCGNKTQNTSSDNLLDTMPDSEWKTLNIFFSNFSEANMDFFDSDNYDDLGLINFAISHNVRNDRDRFEDDKATGETYLPEKYVKETIKKYFGIERVVPQDDPGEFFKYDDSGKYFYYDVFEGSPWFTGSQVVELYDNHDGTFFAIIEVYVDNDKFQEDPDGMAPAFYEPKKEWKPATSERCELSRYHIARIEKHKYEGKQIYKLLELNNTDSLEEARERMKQLISWTKPSTEGQEEEAIKIGMISYEEVPESADISGCSCWLSNNRKESDNGKYIYLDDFGHSVAIMKINNRIEVFQITPEECSDVEEEVITGSSPNYELRIVKTDFRNAGYEAHSFQGFIELTNKKEDTAQQKFWGTCGC